MQYRINPKNGDRISALAFGCMRFHKDEAEVERQIRYAIDQGVNYFDTAYIYPGSEATLGKILAKDGLRDQVYIATKLPYYMTRKPEDFDRFLNTQLERLQTDRIDYYLIHMLPDVSSWNKLVEMGVIPWIERQKQAGTIRNIGFSFHGTHTDFIKIVDAYDWEFCMIQYNYYDENNQAGKAGLFYAAERGMPVMIMEPLRGGTLVDGLPQKAKALFARGSGGRSAAAWGLRWVWNHPQVTTVLSGMGSQDMVKENIATAAEMEPDALSEEELAVYDAVREEIRSAMKVPCTGCGYCMPCPKGVDIPMCFTGLNDTVIEGKFSAMYKYISMTNNHNASLCVQCGKCETHCPQGIAIREKLGQTQKELEGVLYRPVRFVARKVLKLS